ncbi:MAG: holo-ACP synthase [Thermoactinomyces sp.]
MVTGIGTDLIEFSRIEKVVSRLARRILTGEEISGMPSHPRRRLEFVAGRFAAKEAVSKALGTGIGQSCSFQDITILNDRQGKPVALLSSRLKHSLFADRNVHVHLSISHSEHYVLAMAVIEDDR